MIISVNKTQKYDTEGVICNKNRSICDICNLYRAFLVCYICIVTLIN